MQKDTFPSNRKWQLLSPTMHLKREHPPPQPFFRCLCRSLTILISPKLVHPSNQKAQGRSQRAGGRGSRCPAPRGHRLRAGRHAGRAAGAPQTHELPDPDRATAPRIPLLVGRPRDRHDAVRPVRGRRLGQPARRLDARHQGLARARARLRAGAGDPGAALRAHRGAAGRLLRPRTRTAHRRRRSTPRRPSLPALVRRSS